MKNVIKTKPKEKGGIIILTRLLKELDREAK